LSCDMPLPVAIVNYCICAIHCPIDRLFDLLAACAVNSVIQSPNALIGTSDVRCPVLDLFVRKTEKCRIAGSLLAVCVECPNPDRRLPVSVTVARAQSSETAEESGGVVAGVMKSKQ